MVLPIIERMLGTFIHYKLKDDVAQIAQFLYYDTSYAVPHTNAFSPAAAWYVPFYLYAQRAPGFLRSASAKNEIQKEDEVPLRKITSGLSRNSCSMTVAMPPAIILGVHLGYNAYGT
jgi:hypothetical protein